MLDSLESNCVSLSEVQVVRNALSFGYIFQAGKPINLDCFSNGFCDNFRHDLLVLGRGMRRFFFVRSVGDVQLSSWSQANVPRLPLVLQPEEDPALDAQGSDPAWFVVRKNKIWPKRESPTRIRGIRIRYDPGNLSKQQTRRRLKRNILLDSFVFA